MSPLRRFVFGVVLAAPLSGTLGCGLAMSSARAARVVPHELTLQVTIDPGANQDSVVAVDVVAVETKKTFDKVAAVSAADWFAKKADFLSMNGKDIKVTEWEFVPSSTMPDLHLKSTAGTAGVVMFANYKTKGEHRASLPGTGRVQVRFGVDDFAVRLPKQKPPALPSA